MSEIGYRTSKWQDLTNYECTECPYSTLEEEQIQEHIFGNHNAIALSSLGPVAPEAAAPRPAPTSQARQTPSPAASTPPSE